jgi:hypothetical protein
MTNRRTVWGFLWGLRCGSVLGLDVPVLVDIGCGAASGLIILSVLQSTRRGAGGAPPSCRVSRFNP